MKNERGKTRKIDNPYSVWMSPDGQWIWAILKHYQAPDNEQKNPYARVFTACKSPNTYGTWEYGDAYIHDIKSFGVIDVTAEYLEHGVK